MKPDEEATEEAPIDEDKPEEDASVSPPDDDSVDTPAEDAAE